MKALLLILTLLASGQSQAADTALPQKHAKLIIKITQGKQLWYFGGLGTPQSFTDGATQVTLTALGKTQGTFKWEVIAGADKVHFEGDTASVTKTDDNSVLATGIAASTLPKDVTIRLTYGSQSTTKKIDVRAPFKFKILTPPALDFGRGDWPCDIQNPTNQGSTGYVSFIAYDILDQFGGPVKNAGGTEFLGTKSDKQSNNWAAGTAFPFQGADGGVADAVCVPRNKQDGTLNSPAPQAPSSLVDANPIDVTPQQWFIGSALAGNGVLVQKDDIYRYIDHARHKNIISPVPAP